jgi:hypothetical protein
MTRTTAALVISMLSLTLGACAGRVGFLKPGASYQQFMQAMSPANTTAARASWSARMSVPASSPVTF